MASTDPLGNAGLGVEFVSPLQHSHCSLVPYCRRHCDVYGPLVAWGLSLVRYWMCYGKDGT